MAIVGKFRGRSFFAHVQLQNWHSPKFSAWLQHCDSGLRGAERYGPRSCTQRQAGRTGEQDGHWEPRELLLLFEAWVTDLKLHFDVSDLQQVCLESFSD